jgi:cyclohexanecarboxylate-CoA ligase
MLYTMWGAVLAQGTGVYQDVWDADRQIDLIATAGVTQLFAAPVFLGEMIEAQRRRPRELPSLQQFLTGASPVSARLVRELGAQFDVPVHSCFGMTELGMGLRTLADDPEGWAAGSDGRPLPGLMLDLRPVGDGLYQMWVRGPSLCSAVWQTTPAGEREVRRLWDHNEGWFDTGDVVRSDGRDGVKFAGRANRRIGGMFMVPVEEVEKELLQHPSVREVAVIGHVDAVRGEQPCAVVAPRGRRPSLVDLRGYLAWRGMTEWYLPTKLLHVDALPRNDCGKVDYHQLQTLLGRQ